MIHTHKLSVQINLSFKYCLITLFAETMSIANISSSAIPFLEKLYLKNSVCTMYQTKIKNFESIYCLNISTDTGLGGTFAGHRAAERVAGVAVVGGVALVPSVLVARRAVRRARYNTNTLRGQLQYNGLKNHLFPPSPPQQ